MANKSVFDSMDLSDKSYLLNYLDDMDYETPKETSVQQISADLLVSFKEHPFKVDTDNSDFEELVESVKECGLIYPILVRPKGAKYEIISGHRRASACREAGLKEIPAVVETLSDYEATLIMVHSNLYRPEISVSERAKAYRMLRDEGKHQGVKGTGIAEAVGEKFSDSRRKVYRYIRLSYLNDSLLQMIDNKKLSINAGVELSFLDEESQIILVLFIEEYDRIPSVDQAILLRQKCEQKSFSKEAIISIMIGIAPSQKVGNGNVVLKKKQLAEYFEPGMDSEHISSIIFQLLQKYKDGLLNDYLD